jgi:hypothetical protein
MFAPSISTDAVHAAARHADNPPDFVPRNFPAAPANQGLRGATRAWVEYYTKAYTALSEDVVNRKISASQGGRNYREMNRLLTEGCNTCGVTSSNHVLGMFNGLNKQTLSKDIKQISVSDANRMHAHIIGKLASGQIDQQEANKQHWPIVKQQAATSQRQSKSIQRQCDRGEISKAEARQKLRGLADSYAVGFRRLTKDVQTEIHTVVMGEIRRALPSTKQHMMLMMTPE